MASPSFALATTNYSYNIFCSFHGSDIGKTLLSHILNQFRNEITMFIDSEIERRAEIVPEAIKNSRISIVILSRRYASSNMCLDELVEILESRKTMGQIVMTLFYGVAPADAQCQRHEFGDVFRKHVEGNTDEDIQKWRNALKDVSSIAGVDALYRIDEADMIEKIPTAVLVQLNATPSREFDAMVGLEAHLKEIQFLLDLDSDEVKFFAITGPVGIGKTTIARALHALLSHSFHLNCFEDYYYEGSHIFLDEDTLIPRIQQKVCINLLKDSGINIQHLGNDQRVLIIVDDVRNLTQLEALADKSWFGCGSRIIVTTEDYELLERHGICNTYNVRFPSDEDAIKILCTYAFKQTSPLYGFDNLAKSVIEVCGKSPLDLRIVGSELHGKSQNEWEDEVRRQKSKKLESGLRRRKTSKATKDSDDSKTKPLQMIEKISNDDNKNQLPSRPSRTKDIIEWSLVFTYFILEIPSCVLDQMSSINRPSYALAAMLLSLLACVFGLIDLLYKGITGNVVCQWRPFPWFYYPPPKSNRPFGSFHEMVGLICGVCQSILTSINYSFIIRKVDAPIKVSVWPLIFALGVLFKLCVKKITENNRFLSRPNTSSNMHNV